MINNSTLVGRLIKDSDLRYTSDGTATVELKAGEKVMQGVVVDYKITENDGAFGSRVGGFGSTGK